MAFYLRKAKKTGPFRFNLSKSGIGISGGITGARIGVNSQGRPYVHGGRHGLYYRKNLAGKANNNGQSGNSAAHSIDPNAVVETYHSGKLDKLTTASSRDFVDELQTKANRIELWRWLGVYPAILILLVLSGNILIASASPVGASGYALIGASALLLGVWTFVMYKVDLRRKSLEINYEFDDEVNDLYYDLIEAFNRFRNTAKVWEILTSVKSGSGGASINREVVKAIAQHKLPTPYLAANIKIPYIKLKKIELFFLPERLILRRGKKYAAINYSHLTIKVEETRFTESGQAPADANIIDYTWQHVRKNGEPDRRYKHNPQLPVCSYATYHFESAAGLNELLMTSKPEAMHGFVQAVEGLGMLEKA